MVATPLPSPPRRGCIMTRSLYLKANGEMPCRDDVGESTILRKLDPELLAAGAEHDLVGFDRIVEIRRAFADGRTPFPGLCERCAVREHGSPVSETVPTSLDVLHVEPSYLCRLSCPLCIPSKLRISLKGAPYQMSPEMYGVIVLRRAAVGDRHRAVALLVVERAARTVYRQVLVVGADAVQLGSFTSKGVAIPLATRDWVSS